MSRYKIDPYLFSNEEKLVLKALLNLNTPLKISRQTGIPRPTVYFILEKLKTRGLVKKEKLGKKSIWLLKNMDEVEEYTDLNVPSNQSKQGNLIKIYDSPELILDFLYKFINQNPSRFQFFNGDHNPQYWSKYIKAEEIVKLNNRIRDHNLVSDVISSTSFIKENEKNLGEEWAKSFVDKPTEYHVLNSKYTDFNSQILLGKDKVFILNFSKPIVVEIADPDIHKCLASIFEFIKDNTKSQNLSDIISKGK